MIVHSLLYVFTDTCDIKNMKEHSLVGNNLTIKMEENHNRLKIIGNNNYIKICKNVGSVTIIGDECSIDVYDNYGSVEMISASSTVKINVCNNSDTKAEVSKDEPNRTLDSNKKYKPKKSLKVIFEKFISYCIKKTLRPKK